MSHEQRIAACMAGVREAYSFKPVLNDVMFITPVAAAVLDKMRADMDALPPHKRPMHVRWEDLA